MKKIVLSVLLVLCLAIALFPAVQASYAEESTLPKIVLSEVTAAAGDEVVVTVSTENNPGVGVFTLHLDYDSSKLELVGFEDGAFTGWMVKTTAVWIGTEDSYYNGVILKLKFKVLDTASEGLAKVSVKCEEGDAYNFNEEPIMFQAVSGGVNVKVGDHSHDYAAAVTAPTCTEKGYTTHVCSICGNSYKDNYVDALGHNYADGICTVCGAKGPDYKPPVKENPFVDVYEGSVYYDAILWAYYHEPQQITGGYGNNDFRPQNPCTRAQVVTFLWRAAGCPEPAGDTSIFKDSADIASPFLKAVAWAVEKGITAGFNDGTFRPNDPVTRAQFVTFLWRYEGQPATMGSINGFADAASIATPYQPAVAWAVEKSITTGYEDNTFRPNDVCTRWAVVLFMYRDMA